MWKFIIKSSIWNQWLNSLREARARREIERGQEKGAGAKGRGAVRSQRRKAARPVPEETQGPRVSGHRLRAVNTGTAGLGTREGGAHGL